jgi:hypothetical protein
MKPASPPLRSFLFAPGNHARRVANALSLDADAVILDLEDAVATAEKPAGDRTVNRARQGVTADSLILSRPARAQAFSRSPPAARPALIAPTTSSPTLMAMPAPSGNGFADTVPSSTFQRGRSLGGKADLPTPVHRHSFRPLRCLRSLEPFVHQREN